MTQQPAAHEMPKGTLMNLFRLKPALLACCAGLSLMAANPVLAGEVDSTRLLELMVAKGLVTREEADGLIAEASSRPAALPPVPAGGVANGVQTIPYIPQVVRDQLKQELRTELGAQAQAEGWSAPGQTPDWTRRITLSGDVRVRGEGLFMDKANSDIFEDFGAINAGGGQNINDRTPGYIAPPYLNTLEDRQRARIRARLGVNVQIDDWISAELRIATGNDSSPVSTNQTLGGNGEFGKYALWLDRAAIHLTPVEDVSLSFGRFANPFWTSELLFDEDLNFDGVAVSASHGFGETLKVFGTAGAFPIFNTSLNYGTRNAAVGQGRSFKSQDKYMGAVQLGFDYHPMDRLQVKAAAGYFYFDGVEGDVSSPCYWYEQTCDTDATRPAFQQFGNTLFPIRSVIADPNDPVGSPEVQYFGLAAAYEVLNLRAQVDYALTQRTTVRFEGDFVQNLGLDNALVAARAVNNLGPMTSSTAFGPWDGGDTGWSARLSVGQMEIAQRGDWNLTFGYRYLESDAVLDAFTDSDFHIGGTNNRGWMVGGNYGLGRNTSTGFRWISAEEIADAPFSVDRLIIDLATRF